ncbi:16506_t:CDS:1, partial [Racocetra persica]
MFKYMNLENNQDNNQKTIININEEENESDDGLSDYERAESSN